MPQSLGLPSTYSDLGPSPVLTGYIQQVVAEVPGVRDQDTQVPIPLIILPSAQAFDFAYLLHSLTPWKVLI